MAAKAGRAVLILLASLLASAWAPAAPGDTTVIAPFVLPDPPAVGAGDLVNLTIVLDNLGPHPAKMLWANVTLSDSLAYLNDTAGSMPQFDGRSVSAGRVDYTFSNLPAKNHSFEMRTRVSGDPYPGAVLSTSVFVNCTDNQGVKQPEVHGQGSVRIHAASLAATFTPSATVVDPGDPLSFGVVVTNTGDARARKVWLNVTLPPEVTWTGSNIPVGVCDTLTCERNNLREQTSIEYEVPTNVSTSAVPGSSFTARLSVNYTDASGAPLPGLSRSATVQVRAVTGLVVDKVAGAEIASPGDRVPFTIWHNNTGSAALGSVWINDTLPSGLTYASSAPVGSVVGNRVSWVFAGLAPGSHFVRLEATVDEVVANGTVLQNNVVVDFTDGAGAPGPSQGAAASVIVLTPSTIPVFVLEKVANVTTAEPGEAVSYTIFYNNTGSANAGRVVIRDAIPDGTVLTDAVPSPTGVTAHVHEWEFDNVSVGTHSLRYVLVLQDVAPSTNLVNTAWLNATDLGGRPLPPRVVNELLRIEGGTTPSSDNLLPLVAGIALLAAAGVVAYATYARRSRTVIDEVFLLHKDGLLIKHYTRRMRPDVDSDVLSGMLIAVQNFVNETFIGAEGLQKEGTLDELRFGAFKIVIERGKWIIVAAVLSSDPTNRVKASLRVAIEALETNLGPKLDGWQGDMRSVEGADRYMQDLIAGKYEHARARKD